MLASGSADQTIHLWNPNTGKLKRTLTNRTGWTNPVAFSPDGEKLATGSSDRKVRMWNIQTGEYIDIPEEDARSVIAVAFSPDGQTLATSRANTTVQLWDVQTLLEPISTSQPDPVDAVDVNSDGIVNILDLVSVSSNFGKKGENIADVNGDGVVNIVDLVKVAGQMGTGAAAPAARPQTLEILTAADVQQWLTQAQYLDLTDDTSQRGILMLQQLLATLIPKDTSLLPNYPNPFNPETWIPYHLAAATDVRITIYAATGRVVRQLDLGHQSAGYYAEKSRAVYWDGRNALGEPVASGVYFYTLSAGDFSATRKMLILK